MVIPKTSFIVLVIFVSSLFSSLTTLPGKSFSDISEPADDSTENLAGIALIGSNVVLGSYLASHLATDKASSGMSYLGIGLGLGSIALGTAETTSFSGAVIVAGSIVTTLGIMNLLNNNDTDSPSSEENHSQQSSLVAPYLSGIERGERGVGVLVQMSF